MTYRRSPEHRQAAKERINTTQPWKKSTGPKTKDGKAVVAKNAYRGGLRPALRMLSKEIRRQGQLRDEILKEARSNA